jgi:hypothetical protein
MKADLIKEIKLSIQAYEAGKYKSDAIFLKALLQNCKELTNA